MFAKLAVPARQLHTSLAVQFQRLPRMRRTHQQTVRQSRRRDRRRATRRSSARGHLAHGLDDVMVLRDFDATVRLGTWVTQPLAAVSTEVGCSNVLVAAGTVVRNWTVTGIITGGCR